MYTTSQNNDFTAIHSDFKWNGKSSTKQELLSIAESYVNSDKDYKIQIGFFLNDWFNDNSNIEVQTSGSTGVPKKMWVKKQYMINSALATQDFFDLPAGTTALLCLPATYIAGKLMLVRALILGWDIYSVKPQANPLKGDKTYDFCAMTPYQMEKSFENLERIQKIMVGGGAVSSTLLKKIQSVSSEIYETYAMTETLTHIAARRINGLEAFKKPPFRLLKNVEVKQDKNGCLIIKAPKVTDEIIHTNDIVKLTSSTEFYLKGRIDNVINSGGIKIHPEEVEQSLSLLIEERFFIAGLPDETLGEAVILVIEKHLSQEKKNNLHQNIRDLKNLSRYERPKTACLKE